MAGVYGDVAEGVCFIDHAMSCNGVGVGGSADSALGFSYEQCGRWFQDSLPANLPDAAKDGAAQQYLGSQCKVNYVEDSNIGDQFARHEEESYGAAQTNSNDVNSDAETNEVQTNNDVNNDSQTNEVHTNDDVYNEDETNNSQNSDVYNDAQTNQAQTNDVHNGQTNEAQSNDEVHNGQVLLVQGAVR